jgi:hypothetical protein
MATTLDQIRKLDPKTVSIIRQTKGQQLGTATPEMAQHILQISRAYDIYTGTESDGTIMSAAIQLQKEFPQISIATARLRVSESVSYVHSQMDTCPDEWLEFYADKMDRLGHLCEKNGELEAARRSYEIACEYRVKAAAGRVDPERIKYRRMLVSPDVQAARLGLGGTGMRELLARGKQLIEESGLSSKDKERVLNELELEAGIEDIDYEETDNQ